MKLFLKKGELKWSNRGCHVLDEQGFAIVLENDFEVEFDDEKTFEYVKSIITNDRELKEQENKKPALIVSEDTMIPIVAERPTLQEPIEPFMPPDVEIKIEVTPPMPDFDSEVKN
jgi:hypothetical protein